MCLDDLFDALSRPVKCPACGGEVQWHCQSVTCDLFYCPTCPATIGFRQDELVAIPAKFNLTSS